MMMMMMMGSGGGEMGRIDGGLGFGSWWKRAKGEWRGVAPREEGRLGGGERGGRQRRRADGVGLLWGDNYAESLARYIGTEE